MQQENRSLESMMEEILASSDTTTSDASAISAAGHSVIDEDVLIRGDIMAHSDVIIYGRVEGNINCEDWDVTVYGTVIGDVEGRSLQLERGSIEGNVTVREWMNAQDGTCVKGDVAAVSAGLAGHCEGSIQVDKGLELYESASIIGDVKAGTISMAPGALLRGKLVIGVEDEPAVEEQPAKRFEPTPQDEVSDATESEQYEE